MAGTFPCPHCGATYPVKPVLINRPVRCTQCKNVFMLREDGHADKVEPETAAVGAQQDRPAATQQAAAEPKADPARAAAAARADASARAAAARADASARAAAARASSSPPPTAPSAADRAAAARVQTGPPPESPFDQADDEATKARSETERLRAETESNRTRTSRLKAKQEEMRRTMAATLSDAASKALKSESVKQAAAKTERQNRKQAGAVGELGPAVLTGYGEAEARNSRQWGVGALLLLVVGAVLLWLVTASSPEQRALKAFTEPDPAWRPPSRIQEQQQRAWLADRAMPIILNVNEARITGSRTISLAPLRQVVDQYLKDHVLLPAPGLWIPASQRQAVEQILRDPPADLKPVQALAQNNIVAYPVAALPVALQQAGMSERDAALVAHLLEAQTDFRDGNWMRDFMLEGRVPQTIELSYFHGSNGRRLKLVGQNKYGSDENVVYRGRLMRFIGWSGQQANKDISDWHILDIQVAGRDGSFPEAPGW